ncbi:MAG: hypothetical protein EHM61_07635 [Acidobacteria bacterium]|nr:MAG: hypothetical protein EHM61_07635 [Acidobacteriota bacterium]
MKDRLFYLGIALASTLGITAVSPAQAPATQPAQPPTVITAGDDWIPLKPGLDIEQGSALDFSALDLVDRPAGKHGRVIARSDGQFAFADSPNQPRRFYGVNLCFGAHYISKEESIRLADRLVRLGYNTVRIHHYERDLTQGQPDSISFDPEKIDQFDYLMASLIRRGIYLTTDLYVSRPVPYREIGIDQDGAIPMNTFKIMVPVHDRAFENWKAFTRALLGHVNPYTGHSYAKEPALAWIALINEGNYGNFIKEILTIPEWKLAWNRWLVKRYPNRESLSTAWGAELQEGEDPASQSVGLPQRLQDENRRTRDCVLFFADTERHMVKRMQSFLRQELGCQALLSNASSWTRFTTDQAARMTYDYVDEHFYVDHPQFLQSPWRLPSRCPNTSPIAGGAAGGRGITFTRLFDKPFTVTEYNYSAPGRFRGVGGILTGALVALQGWGGIWRFAYSHSREAMFTPTRMGYFDMATDPLGQAAERASLCLFLRGDLQMAPKSVALVMTDADLAQPTGRIPNLAPRWHWLAWITRIGTQVLPSPEKSTSHSAILPLGWQTPASAYPANLVLGSAPYSVDDQSLVTALQERKLFPANAILDPGQRSFRSETGEVTIDGPGDRLVLDTLRTAGGYASAGQSVEAPKGGVKVSLTGSDATVWVSALDRNPIGKSRRLLVTHLTDLQNSGIQYAEPARQTLQDWGGLPYLVRAGKAEVSLRLKSPGKYRVWALSVTGKRVAEVPARVEGDALNFTLDVAGDPAGGARMMYEVVRK